MEFYRALNKMEKDNKAILALLLCVILWSSAFVGIRYIMVSYSAGGMALLRYFVASIAIIYPFMRVKPRRIPTLREIPGFFILGILGFTLYNVALNYGERTVHASIANFIISQVPIMVVIIGVFLFKEKITKAGWLGFVISILGTLFIMLGESTKTVVDLGVMFIYVAAIAAAIYSIWQKSYVKRYHPIEVTAYAIWAGTLALMIYTPSALSDLSHSHWQDILIIIYMGVFPGALGYSLWCYGFKSIHVAKAASYLYFMPLLTIFFAWLLLSEVPNITAVIGGIIASIGSIITNKFGLAHTNK